MVQFGGSHVNVTWAYTHHINIICSMTSLDVSKFTGNKLSLSFKVYAWGDWKIINECFLSKWERNLIPWE